MNTRPTQTTDPREIVVAVPCHTGRIDVLTANGLCNIIGTGRIANQPLWNYGGSNVGAVRNDILHTFLTLSDCQWLMMIDDDIGFTVDDWDLLWEDQAGELAVCAEYLQKIDGEKVAAQFGLGFARVHRTVFERLMAMTLEDGTPFLRQGYYAGKLLWEFFPQGVTVAGEYRQEDHGFWQLVRIAQVSVRIERRCKLAHSGRSTWRYDADELAAADADESMQ
jgi:hypothetical protein